jgi:hypothetical protein
VRRPFQGNGRRVQPQSLWALDAAIAASTFSFRSPLNASEPLPRNAIRLLADWLSENCVPARTSIMCADFDGALRHQMSHTTGVVANVGNGEVRGCGEWPVLACAVPRRRFPVGANPTRRTAPAGSTGATIEETTWLKPSGKRATTWWQRECAGRNASKRRVRPNF